MATSTILISDSQIKKVIEILKKAGLKEVSVKAPYERFRFTGDGVTVVLYKTGKLLLQGRDISKLDNQIQEGVSGDAGLNTSLSVSGSKKLTKTILAVDVDLSSRIGSDEVGKGDYFGPMVVAACYVTKDIIPQLIDIGVTDSKKLTDAWIQSIFDQVHELVDYEFLIIDPVYYAESLRDVKNVAILLADGHSEVISKLLKRLEVKNCSVDRIVVDQFSKSERRLLDEMHEGVLKYKIDQRHHGESDIAVALASIIARTIFLAQWANMEDRYSFKFPKGATNVIGAAKQFVERFGEDELRNVAKVSFRTTKQVLGYMLE